MKQFACSNLKKKKKNKSCAERNKKYIQREVKLSNISHGQRQVYM